MNEIDSIIARVRNALERTTPRELAITAGLSKNALYGFDRPDWNPSARTLRAVLPYLDK